MTNTDVDPNTLPPDTEKDFNYVTIWVDYLRDRTNTPRLVLGKNDNDYFKDNIIARKPSEYLGKAEKKSSNNRIRKAYNFFLDKLKKMEETVVSDHLNWYTELDNLFHSFTEGFTVIALETSDLAEAYTIFETLNARGKELAASDLLKNYLLKTINEKGTEETLNKWNVISQKLDDDLPAYIRYYWNSHKKFTRKKDLYKDIISEYTDRSSCIRLFNELYRYYELFYELNTGKCEDIIKDSDLAKYVQDLKLLGASTYYPIIIALFKEDYAQADIAKVANAILVYFFRNIKVYGMTANSTELFFSSIACTISEKKPPVDDIVKKISDEILDDQIFVNAIKELSTKDKNLIRYIFRTLHLFLSPSGHELNLDNNKVHIEHIMPVDPSKWNVNSDFHEEYLWKIGNLTLLSQKLNDSIKQKTFADKKEEAYKQSDIIPTKELVKYTQWGKDEIEQRQTQIAHIALDIWSLK